MKSVGIRELKRSISAHLRRVQAGERILVTDRRKPVAVISAVENNEENEIIKQLSDAGVAYWTGGKPSGAVPRIDSKESVSDAVLEDRR